MARKLRFPNEVNKIFIQPYDNSRTSIFNKFAREIVEDNALGNQYVSYNCKKHKCNFVYLRDPNFFGSIYFFKIDPRVYLLINKLIKSLDDLANNYKVKSIYQTLCANYPCISQFFVRTYNENKSFFADEAGFRVSFQQNGFLAFSGNFFETEAGAVEFFFNYYKNLLKELDDFSVDVTKLDKKLTWGRVGSFLLGVAATAGVIAIKGAVRAVLNADLDFDTNGIISGLDFSSTPDFDFDTSAFTSGSDITDLGLTLDGSDDLSSYQSLLGLDSSDAYSMQDGQLNYDSSDSGTGYSPSGYNVSFGSQHATLESPGGIKLDATIEKESGTSNHFTITTSKGTVTHVQGGTHSVKINGIKYILPALKG